MNPIKAQRTWHSLSTKWINGTSFGRGRPLRNSRRKIRKGLLFNLIPVEIVNAITGEVHKGYMRDVSIRKLRKWLEFHNHRAQVEQVSLPVKSTFYRLNKKEDGLKELPVLIKLGRYQVPYLIDHVGVFFVEKGKPTITFNLQVVDNLKYLETVALKKTSIMKLFNKIKKAKRK